MHPSPLCPLCRTHEHTTQHLFSCPQIPTTLSALDLWRDPSGVAALLDDWREKLAANPIRQQKRTPPNKQGGSVGRQQQQLYITTTARFVLNNFRRKASVSEMLHDLCWQSLDGRRQDQRLVLFLQIINGLASVETEDILTPADSRTRKNHSFNFIHLQANCI